MRRAYNGYGALPLSETAFHDGNANAATTLIRDRHSMPNMRSRHETHRDTGSLSHCPVAFPQPHNVPLLQRVQMERNLFSQALGDLNVAGPVLAE